MSAALPGPEEEAPCEIPRTPERPWEQKVAQLEAALRHGEDNKRRTDHLQRVLRATRSINQLLLRETHRDRLMQEVCAILVRERGVLGAWIVLTDRPPSQIEGAQAGVNGRAFARLLSRLRKGVLPACCETARKEGRKIALHNPMAACVDCPLREVYGPGRGVNLPILHGEHLFGILGVAMPNAFTEEEQECLLLTELAGDLAFALHRIETAAERDRSQQTLRVIFESARDGILLYDTEADRFVAGNGAMGQMLGYSAEDLRALPMEAIHPKEKMADVRALVERLLQGGLHLAADVPVKRKDGTVFLADVNATAFTLDGRQHLLGIFRDVTTHKKLEAQLLRSQKLEAAGHLAGGVAHDFNNLLTGILGYTELCLRGIATDHPLHPLLHEITREIERAASLSRQLMAFAHQQTIAPKVLNLNDAVEGMLRMLRQLMAAPIEITWQPAPSLRPVKIDPSQVDQIIANLCVNARDAVGGAGQVTLETANVEWHGTDDDAPPDARPGSYAMLAVSDNGCGMSDETMAHLFEPFFTTKGAGHGNGLGLSTVYGIVRQNNGFIRVQSEPGKGSTFRVYFPCCAEAAGPAPDATPPARARAPLPGGRERILLVEDEKSIRLTTQAFLEALGYRVQAAESPEIALRLAAECSDPIDLLVTDVLMPGLSGLDLAQRLRPQRPAMKCLFMSGYNADVIARQGVLPDGVAFLSKPFSRDTLAFKVRTVLDGTEACAAPSGV